MERNFKVGVGAEPSWEEGDALCCSVSLRNNSLCQSTALLIFELRVDFGSKHEFYSHLCSVGKKAVEKSGALKGSARLHLLLPVSEILSRGSTEAGECALVL